MDSPSQRKCPIRRLQTTTDYAGSNNVKQTQNMITNAHTYIHTTANYAQIPPACIISDLVNADDDGPAGR